MAFLPRVGGVNTSVGAPRGSRTARLPPAAGARRAGRGAAAAHRTAPIGCALQIVGERLCEVVDLHAGERVLDLASDGAVAMVAARHFADVTCLEPAPSVAAFERRRASQERLAIAWESGDAAAPPFPQAGFDLILSAFGAAQAADAEAAAQGMLRALRPGAGGRIGLASWTSEGFMGKLLTVLRRHTPSPAGAAGWPSDPRWGLREGLRELFPQAEVAASIQICHFRYLSPEHWLKVFRASHAPSRRAFDALGPTGRAALEAEVLELVRSWNRSGDATVVVPAAYLEAVVTPR